MTHSYLDLGSKENDVLVFIHGLGSTKESWRYQFEFSKSFRVIVPDLRGHGESTINDDISLKNFAKDIIELLHELDIEEAHFCGLSLGGVIAQEILSMNSDLVKSMILSNTTSYLPYTIGSMAVDARERNLGRMDDLEYLHHTLSNCFYLPHFAEEVAEFFFKLNRHTYIHAANSIVGINYIPTLFMNRKPLLILGSVNDAVTPMANARTAMMFAKGAKMHTFYKCGHLPNVEKREEFNEVVLSFLNAS